MRLQLKSIFVATTCFCLLLLLNSIPWQSRSVVNFYDYIEGFKVNVTSYGWPYTYQRKYSAYDLPDQLPGDLTREDIESEIIDQSSRIFDNAIIAGLISIGTLLLSEMSFRRWAGSFSELETAG